MTILESLALIASLIVGADDMPCPPQLTCVALAVFSEANTQSLEGRLAVAEVVVNRGRDTCAVIQAKSQFEGLARWPYPREPMKIDARKWGEAIAVSALALRGEHSRCQGANAFYNPDLVSPSWAVGRKQCVIGDHVFLFLPDRAGSQLER